MLERGGDFSHSLAELVRAHLGLFEQHPKLIQLYLGVAERSRRKPTVGATASERARDMSSVNH